MSESGKWLLPLTIGVGAATVMAAIQIITRSEREVVEEGELAEKIEGGSSLVADPHKDDSPLEDLMDKAGNTQLDEPEASSVVRDIVNADTSSMLNESYCQVSPKQSPIEKVDSAWRPWGWFSNP